MLSVFQSSYDNSIHTSMSGTDSEATEDSIQRHCGVCTGRGADGSEGMSIIRYDSVDSARSDV
jgi:hypothetical protein